MQYCKVEVENSVKPCHYSPNNFSASSDTEFQRARVESRKLFQNLMWIKIGFEFLYLISSWKVVNRAVFSGKPSTKVTGDFSRQSRTVSYLPVSEQRSELPWLDYHHFDPSAGVADPDSRRIF